MLNNKNSNIEIKRIVILGHTGFIGSHLENFFKNNTNIAVVGKDLPLVDLTNYSSVLSLKDFFDMDTAVIMCSAIKRDQGDNTDNFLKNIKMVINICRLMETYPVKRFLFFSSAAVYGEDIHNLNISEKTDINPTSYYGMAKYISERLLRKTFDSKDNSNLIIVRPTVIYGPGDRPCYGPSGFINSAVNGEAITLWGDGTEKREFIFIEDAIKLINNLIFDEYDGVLNVASGKSYAFSEIIDMVSSLTNSNIEINSRERTKNKVDNEFDNSALLKIFPEFTFTPLKEGIQKTVESLKSRKIAGA